MSLQRLDDFRDELHVFLLLVFGAHHPDTNARNGIIEPQILPSQLAKFVLTQPRAGSDQIDNPTRTGACHYTPQFIIRERPSLPRRFPPQTSAGWL
jgi:hypothetical protein